VKRGILSIIFGILVIGCSIASAEQFTLHLTKGDNFVSIPLNITISEEDFGVSVEIWEWDAKNQTWKMVHEIEGGKGYYIYSPYDITKTFEGEPLYISADDILENAEPGWNLIGVGWNPIEVKRFLVFDVYEYQNGEYVLLEDTDTLQPGKSYWLGMFIYVKGTAFSDFNVNEDGEINEADLQKVQNHLGETVSTPSVSKYDFDLDGSVDCDDVQKIQDVVSYLQNNDVSTSFAVGVWRYGNLYIIYFKDLNEAQKFEEFYDNWLTVGNHTHAWSNDVYDYVCADFPVDAYWTVNKLFLNGTNYYVVGVDEYGFNETRTIYPPIAIGEGKRHAFNYLIIGKDITDKNSWVIFEPQGEGDHIFTWDELTPCMVETYGSSVNTYFEEIGPGFTYPSAGYYVNVTNSDFSITMINKKTTNDPNDPIYLPSWQWAIGKITNDPIDPNDEMVVGLELGLMVPGWI